MATWPPKLGTLNKVPSELFLGLKSSLFPQGFAHNTAEVLVECEKNGGWRGVFEFGFESLTVLCYFCSGFYTTRRQIDGKVRYVAIFSVFEKNMSLMYIKLAFIWWYFCIMLHDCVAWSKVFKDEILKFRHMRLSLTDRADHAVDLISICVYFILRQANGKALRFPQETL